MTANITVKTISKLNNAKWYLLIVAINCLWIIQLSFTIKNPAIPSIMTTMLNEKLTIIPYLIVCGGGYYILFVGKLKNSIKRTVIVLLIAFLLISTVSLTFIGNLPFIDNRPDNDEGLETFINCIFQGDYPYTHTVQNIDQNGGVIFNRLTFLPFLPIYSIGFFILGNVAYQNIVNMIILILIVWYFAKYETQKLFGYVVLALFLPLHYGILTQSDHVTVATGLLLITVLLYKQNFFAGSVLTGCMIASKGYFWLIVPAIIVTIYKHIEIKKWICSCIIIAGIAALFIVPFILWDSHTFLNFAPIGVLTTYNSSWLPHSNILMPAVYCAVSFFCAWKLDNIFLTTIIVYIVSSLTLLLYVTLPICLMLLILGLMDYGEVPEVSEKNSIWGS